MDHLQVLFLGMAKQIHKRGTIRVGTFSMSGSTHGRATPRWTISDQNSLSGECLLLSSNVTARLHFGAFEVNQRQSHNDGSNMRPDSSKTRSDQSAGKMPGGERG